MQPSGRYCAQLPVSMGRATGAARQHALAVGAKAHDHHRLLPCRVTT